MRSNLYALYSFRNLTSVVIKYVVQVNKKMTRVKGLGSTAVLQAISQQEEEGKSSQQGNSTDNDESNEYSSSQNGDSSEEEEDNSESTEGNKEANNEADGKSSDEGDEGDGKSSDEGDEGDGDEDLDFIDDELEKLAEPPSVLTKAHFLEKYGFEDEGVVPSQIKKWQGRPFDDSKCVALFGQPVGRGGRYGYNWKGVKSQRIHNKIKDLLQALYQVEVPRPLLPHKMARGRGS